MSRPRASWAAARKTRRSSASRPFLLALAIIWPVFAGSTLGGAARNPDDSDSFLQGLRDQARGLAQQAHRQADAPPLPDTLKKLDYDGYHAIGARPEHLPWANEGLPFELQFLHRGYLFLDAVQINLIDKGAAQRLEFKPEMFNYGQLKVPLGELKNLDFAGFRLMWRSSPENVSEIASFVGASYFRFIGKGQHYGSSARGLAVDTGESRGEEFPRFTQFWLRKPDPSAKSFTLYAMMESPSVTGAFRFILRPGAQTSVATDASLFARAKEKKNGIAPLTSMFLMGENRTRFIPDFRPEVHDCDGLLIQLSDGTRTWRPVSNPERKHQITRIPVSQLSGFGLMQRDRNYSSYVDLQAQYEMRPGLWVAPTGDWGKGHVELVEIPTTTEYNDNIVAYWVPEGGLVPGQEARFQYTITALDRRVDPGDLMEVESTRINPEHEGKPPRFVIDFLPSQKTNVLKADKIEARVSASQGEIRNVVTQTNSVTGGWRLFFDHTGAKDKKASLEAALTHRGAVVSETWMYHLHEP